MLRALFVILCYESAAAPLTHYVVMLSEALAFQTSTGA